jgi:hypothetical protein
MAATWKLLTRSDDPGTNMTVAAVSDSSLIRDTFAWVA